MREMAGTLTITCEHCGKVFESNRKKRFCSRYCAYKHRYETVDKYKHIPVDHEEKNCKYCGARFKPNHERQLYCSPNCQRKDWYSSNRRKGVYCIVCGKEIIGGSGGSKYCSEECSDKAHTKICKECGKEFVPKYAGHYRDDVQYCSPECASNAQKDKTLYVCKHCGKTFHRRKQETDQCLFCSRQCASAYKAEHRPMVQGTFYFGFELKCQHCGNTFFSYSKNARFCSKECKKDWDKEHAKPMTLYLKECQHCGKKFWTKYKNQLYCSLKCQDRTIDKKREIRRRSWAIKNGGTYDNSISLQKLVKRDHGLCAICGKPVDMKADPNSNEYGSIDHITPLAKGGTHTWNNVQLTHRICNSIKSDII